MLSVGPHELRQSLLGQPVTRTPVGQLFDEDEVRDGA